jgi:hypothetical protein
MGKIYDKLIERHRRRVSFVVLVSFLLTFVFVRFYVLTAGLGIIDDPYLYIRGYHIHHLNYGICIMAISGFWALTFQNERDRLKIGVLYGIGLGLTFDEFGMWLRLQDDYWARTSYDAIIIIALIFISFVYFPSFWYRLLRRAKKDLGRIINIKANQ